MPLAFRRLVPRNFLEDHLPGLAIGNLRRVHNPRTVVIVYDNPVQKDKHRKCEIQVQQRLRR